VEEKNHFLTDERKQKQNENNDVEIDDQGDYYEDIRGQKFRFMRRTIYKVFKVYIQKNRKCKLCFDFVMSIE